MFTFSPAKKAVSIALLSTGIFASSSAFAAETVFVPGETKAANGDVVSYNGDCFTAKNNPGTWETPKAGSWFWDSVQCSGTNPVEEVTCPDGSKAATLAECPKDIVDPVICIEPVSELEPDMVVDWRIAIYYKSILL